MSRAQLSVYTILAVLAVVAIGRIQYLSGPEITFSLFYLLPVGAAAWWLGSWAACAAALAAAASGFLAEAAWFPHQQVALSLWNGSSRLGLFLIVGVSLAHARRSLLRARADRERAEAEREGSEIKYRELVHGLSDGIFAADTRGVITFANRALTTIHGLPAPADLIGHPYLEFLDPASRPEAERFFRRVARGDVPEAVTAKAVRPDGGIVSVELRPTLVIEHGVVVGMWGMVRDITERERAEAEHERLISAIEQAAESVVITNAPGDIQYVNPAFERLTGYARQEVLGKNPRILKSGQHDAAFYREMWDTLTAGGVWAAHFVNKRKDGTLYHQQATISCVRDGGGRIVNFVAVGRDISREVALEAQLNQAQRMEAVGRLAGGVAHDFNNLLTVILGSGHFLLESLAPDHPARADADEILKAGTRAAGLTRQLLAFSRRQVLEPRVLDLNVVVRDMDKLLRRLIGEDIDVLTALAKDLEAVYADPGQVEQVIANLAVNARDAMPQGGKLTIETANVVLDEGYVADHPGAKPGPHVMLAVSDTGTGMTAETKAHLFEPFFTTKAKGKGTGLGLATVYGIVKQSGGHISAYSELGQGSTFKIYLPRVAAEDGGPSAPPADPRSLQGSETILIAEDDLAVATLGEKALTARGYRVLVARGGDAALSLAGGYPGPIHLLVTDVVMPVMGGKALAEHLSGVRPGLRVLYVSGYTDEAIVHQGILDPGIAFLQKPFTPDSLARKVREVLDAPQGLAGSMR